MATSSRSRSQSGLTKTQSESASVPQRNKRVKQKSAATAQAATAQAATAQAATAQAATQENISKKVKFSELPTTNGVAEEEEVEEEYEVECICAHQWSDQHQEYEYFLKWKGYGEEDNSWVPASLMNCWDLLQRYLSANIFNSPAAAALSTPGPINRTVTPKGKGHSRTKEPRRNRGLKNGRTDHTVHSAKANGHPVAHVNDPVTSNERLPMSQSEVSKGKKGELFSTPKPPLSTKLSLRRQKVAEPSSRVKHKCQQSLQLEKTDECNPRPPPCHSTALPSPSASPLMSSCDDFSSSQSDCSVSVDDTFRLYLDSDEDSSNSGSQSLLRESPFREDANSEQSSYAPKVHHISISQAQHGQVNGLKNSESRHANSVKATLKQLPNGHSGKPKEKLLMKKNGISQNLPTSTTSSAADNTDSDTSESWSKRRLRKRGRSSSPTPSLDSTNLETTVDQAEVSSTISPPVVSPQVLQRRLSPSPEYQQELLEWQFLLNKQCRPGEAFILVENRIDEAPVPWNVKYITTNMYGDGVPNPQKPDMAARICGCTCYIMGKRCLPKNEHCCPKMAGADFPYSLAGKVRLPPGNPIYECNSRCSCPSDCTNRIVQHGRKINMCIFRTANGRGWGVKTMEPIKPNTFVTEYVGEVVTTDEAERRGQLYDQEGRTYLFDLDFNCDDNAFTIDAAHYGNISHFFNHSCNPNLRVYSVWIDTLDERLPRIAFFSTQSISAGQELTFDYQMNQEEDGQVSCLCGEPNCCGYLY